MIVQGAEHHVRQNRMGGLPLGPPIDPTRPLQPEGYTSMIVPLGAYVGALPMPADELARPVDNTAAPTWTYL